MISKVLVIHPYDKSTLFLARIADSVSQVSMTKYIHIGANDQEHDECLDAIRVLPEGNTIIFLGHGRSDLLQGSKGDHFSIDAGGCLTGSYGEQYYFRETFISRTNINILDGKRVFCLSCNSVGAIGNLAINAGAQAFFGFGNLPTSLEEFSVEGYVGISSDIVSLAREELQTIVSTSLRYAIQNGLTFGELRKFLGFLVSQRIAFYLSSRPFLDNRFALCDFLFRLKRDAKVLGNNYLKLV